MSLECSVEIVVRLPRAKAEAVQKALEPDNIGFPEGLSLDARCENDSMVLCFKSRNARSLIASVDEVLEHISVAAKVME